MPRRRAAQDLGLPGQPRGSSADVAPAAPKEAPPDPDARQMVALRMVSRQYGLYRTKAEEVGIPVTHLMAVALARYVDEPLPEYLVRSLAGAEGRRSQDALFGDQIAS